jgi:hypothetical protein
MSTLETVELSSWDQTIPSSLQQHAINALENGKVLYFPKLAFQIKEEELPLLSPNKADDKSKNISFDIRTGRLNGTQCSENEVLLMKAMIKRYATYSRELMSKLFPFYNTHLIQARTSFRPVEIAGRKSSYRKDDTLLHVDSFPATPTKGQRIMRFFTNINPQGKPRVWKVGEPFSDVVDKIAPYTTKPFPGLSFLLKTLKITKDYRTPYDHYMLQLHNRMKGDAEYQKFVPQEQVSFMPGDTWIVYTDQVSHAALSGQHVMEQTYHLPQIAIKNQSSTPLAILERYYGKKLI